MPEFKFQVLGQTVRQPSRVLEVFPKPEGITTVTMESDEVTSLCPVTGQPDWETVTIEYAPNQSCIESKSLKLYLWSFREDGVFCEALAAQIANDIATACQPYWVEVAVNQKPRGGVKLVARARVESQLQKNVP
ncbi:MAG TPA: preQ(1) synthase [Bacillota bacterium]|nr:preQ(1) synthase [Bacillota bacterium]